jgi:hypothetical protein
LLDETTARAGRFDQRRHRARALLAVGEVGAHHHGLHLQAVEQARLEGRRSRLRVLGREGLHDGGRRARRFEQLELALLRDDQPRSERRLQHLARVRVKRERRDAAVARRLGEERLVTEVHAIEVAEANRGALQGTARRLLNRLKDLHRHRARR